MTIKGFGIRSIDDSREGCDQISEDGIPPPVLLPGDGDTLIGAILCGHDGRRGCLYHVCVREGYRRQGVGKAMVVACMEALQERADQQSFPDRIYQKRYWKCILEQDRLDRAGRSELL